MSSARVQEAQPQPDQPAPHRTLAEIAAALGAEVSGDGEIEIREVVHPRMASSATDLAFVMDQGAVDGLVDSPICAAVVADGLTLPDDLLAGVIQVRNPRYALAMLLDLFDKPPHAPAGIHPSAVVDRTARLGDGVSVGALSYIGPEAEIGAGTVVMPQVSVGAGARIGADCLLHPGVRVGERVIVGDRAILQHNASIGADGFSYVTPDEPSFEQAKKRSRDVTVQNQDIRRINSIGTVILGNDVEVGANAAIDRANLGATTIGDGTKIDNLVMIGHNNRIGEGCLISGHVGISGSCRIGDRVVLAGRAGVADHITIGDDVVVGAGSGVWRDVDDKQIVAGYPALPKSEALAREANIGRIRRILKDLGDLRKRVAELEKKDG
ncbi:MAG: UDP-3-O-(3-hydroxymyristoyl)glucosamine N-acyltransferase [Alphaproteobacteria bacterium]|nr:UDP-3-O-(3-hydroxymyristoyl)glucosamine N-acyltransferase [Alphaproteobacteria bacterium]